LAFLGALAANLEKNKERWGLSTPRD